MRTVKTIDFYSQVVLIIAGIIFPLLSIHPDAIFISYFVVGGWQVMSCMVHFFVGDFYPARGRKYYLNSLLMLVVIGMLLSAFGALIIFLIALLFVSPIYAVWYTYICYREVQMFRNKEWLLLK